MATKKRGKTTRKGKKGNSRLQDTKDVLGVGLLVGAILAILILGAALKIEPPEAYEDLPEDPGLQEGYG